MIDVRLSKYTVDVDDPIVVSVSGHEGVHHTTQIGVVVVDLNDVDNAWTVKTVLPARVSDGTVQTTIHRAGGSQPDKMLEIRVLELQSSEGTIATLAGGRDFPRTFFCTRAHAEEPSMIYEEVVSAAGEVEKERETRLAVPLGDPWDPEAAEFRVLMFVERLLLTNYMRVPGIELLPLSNGNPATDEANIVNSVLAELGWNAGVDPSWWADKNSRERPILLVRIGRVFAATHEKALLLAHQRRDRLLDIMALQRGSSGVPFATVVQKLVDAEGGKYTQARIYPEGKPYTGNLSGGGVSGEDSRSLLVLDRAAGDDSFLRLCVSLYNVAQADGHPDFQYFRYWSLLEVLAAKRVESGTRVTDFEGQPLSAGNTAATTDSARGRVYELIKRWMQSRNHSEQNFTRPVSRSLWDMVSIWYARRNATAHYGAFVVGDPRQQSKSWYRRALESHDAAEQQGGIDICHLNLREATKAVLLWELRAAFSASENE